MRFLITAGPTYESLDKVRRLTNFSTGTLGIALANSFHDAGHEVTLLKGYYAICPDVCRTRSVTFTTTQDLLERLEAAAKERFDGVFHAAAVSDFGFGAVYRRLPDGKLDPVISGKFGTREGNLLAELVPTPKIISRLRELFASALIVGWKYEVDGSREEAIAHGRKQVIDNRTNCCVVNGPPYGTGFGVVSEGASVEHCNGVKELGEKLLNVAIQASPHAGKVPGSRA